MKVTTTIKHTLGLMLVLGVALFAGQARAVTFDLDFVADADSRFFDMFSAAFAQIDQGHNGNAANDGFFSVADETNSLISGTTQLNVGNESAFDAFSPVNFVQFGGVDLFPSEGNFTSIGSLDYDSGTSVVTSLSLDVFPFAQDNFSILAGVTGSYATSLSNVVGTVTQQGAGLSSIDVTADIQFTYGGAVNYNGSLVISGNSFDIFVDEAPFVPDGTGGFFPFRLSWDLEGTVANLVPEPTSAVLGMIGLVFYSQARSRR
ncbi:MAG: hypothetical protein AAGB19_04320 [Cyanobacteria bacterium P01_F01_bin.3]